MTGAMSIRGVIGGDEEGATGDVVMVLSSTPTSTTPTPEKRETLCDREKGSEKGSVNVKAASV